MNQDIERLAKEAGVEVEVFCDDEFWSFELKALTKFAALIAEDCAKESQPYEVAIDLYDDGHNAGQHAMARRIRAKYPMPNK